MKIKHLLKSVRMVWKLGKAWLITTILFSIIAGLIPVTALWITKELINAVANLIMDQAGDYRLALSLLLLQFLISLFSSVMTNWQEYLDRKIELRLDHDLQQVILAKTTSVPLAYFDIPDFYHHLSRVQGNQGSRFVSPIRNLLNIGKSGIVIGSFLIYLFTVHWSLVLLSLVAAVPIFLVQRKFGNSKFRLFLFQTPLAREANYTSHLLQDRNAAKEIRLFGLASHLAKRWSDRFWRNANQSLKLLRKQQLADVGLDGLTALFYVGSAGIIIWLIRTTSVKIGDFVAIGQAVQGTQSSINQISMLSARIYEESLYIQNFFHFLEYENQALISETGTQPFPAPLKTGIEIDAVTFSYPGQDRPVLQNVSFQIRPGEKVAIVGENGSGKTTLVKCLMGLYPVTSGSISLDGLNIKQIDKSDLYQHITVIFQDYMRYSYSAHDNIAFGDIERLDDHPHVQEVAATSGVDEFVQKFPNGYNTYLGRFLQDGEDLSGGQWQKIALARALFRDGDVIILDEPTAALDPHAEMEVFRQFESLTRDKTSIFISHRMSAARMADRIIVMKDGQVVEIGSHEELIALNAEYAQMYGAQAKWYA